MMQDGVGYERGRQNWETHLECGEVKPRGDDIDERHAAPDAPSGAQHPFQLHVVPAKRHSKLGIVISCYHSSVGVLCEASGPVHLAKVARHPRLSTCQIRHHAA